MKELKYTLITDGSSDSVLMNVIKWLLDDLYPELSNKGVYANFSHLQNPPKKSEIQKRINLCKEYFPYDVLFYHRDAESIESDIVENRIIEIKDQITEEDSKNLVCVIPVKMMESWFLIDSDAIKKAAGNRNFSGNLVLPSLNRIEKEKEPKAILHSLLREASGLKKRSLNKFNVHKSVHLVGEYIEDYSELRKLNSFSKFEVSLKAFLSDFVK